MLGSPFQWQLANGSAVQESEACSFHVDTGAEEQAVVPLDLVMNGERIWGAKMDASACEPY